MVIANILKKIPQKCRIILEFLNFRALWQWPTWVSEIGNQSGDKNDWYLVGHVILLNICLLNCFIHRNWPDWSLQSYRSTDQIPNYYNGWIYRAGQAAHNFYARTVGKVLTNAFGDIFCAGCWWNTYHLFVVILVSSLNASSASLTSTEISTGT